MFDLLFLVAFLALVIAMATAAFRALRGQRDRAVTVVRRTGATATAYFGVVAVVSIATPRGVVPIGQAQCFDDWCITALSAQRAGAGDGDSLRVTLRLSSRARGITQGERDVRVYVVDDRGGRYLPIEEPGGTPLSVQIRPEGSIATSRLFILPADARHPVLIVAHDLFPHCCIIADRESLLHRRTVVPLD